MSYPNVPLFVLVLHRSSNCWPEIHTLDVFVCFSKTTLLYLSDSWVTSDESAQGQRNRPYNTLQISIFDIPNSLEPAESAILLHVLLPVPTSSDMCMYVLSKYLESNNLLTEEQNGFRQGRSCQDHILVLHNLENYRD